MHNKYIVLAGKKQVGKDTFAKFLTEHIGRHKDGYSCLITAFAQPLKDFCYTTFGIPYEKMSTEDGKQSKTNIKWSSLDRSCVVQDGYMEKTGYLTVRELLQYVGTNILRNRFYKEIWTDALFAKEHRYQYNGSLMPYDFVIVTDCRFKNELNASLKHGASVIRIMRNTSYTDNHSSENDLDDIQWDADNIIDNNSSLEELNNKAKYMSERILRMFKC